MFFDNPPLLPLVARLLIKTLLSLWYSFILILSPKMAPPVNGLVGSTLNTAILFFLDNNLIISLVIELFPAPGGPVIPSLYDCPVLL